MTVPETLTALYFQATDRMAARPVLMRWRRDRAWRDVSTRDFTRQVREVSLGLLAAGVEPGERVALLSENRPEWAVVDFACLTAGCADVPVYPTLPAGQIEYILRDSGARLVFVSTRTQLEKIRQIRDRLPRLETVVVFDQVPGDDAVPLDHWRERGRAAAERFPDWRARALRAGAGDLATIIYTSGTTGDPKGVMLSHGNITTNVRASLVALDVREGDECLSFLPLSHIFERMAGHYVMIWTGVVINYAKGVETVSTDLVDRAPTVMTSVPRLYEKMYARVCDAAMKTPGRARVFRWARQAGEEWADRKISGRPISPLLALRRRLADGLVFAKLRERTGGRVRFLVSGGAPLSADIARFFYAAGLPILEGYGLTETSPVIAVNTLDAMRFGSVGRPVDGVEVRIAPDGEILARGPNIMLGYFENPAATAEAIGADGWFHTGDIGHLDDDGFLYITDRKKDLIVTAGGKNIAPQPIENRLRLNRFIANAIMLGDRRKYPIALLVPEFDAVREWAAARGLEAADDAALAERPEVRQLLELEARKHLRDLAQFEVPKKFLVLGRDLSIERGELTPKLSVRRRVVEHYFRERISALYNESGELERVTIGPPSPIP